MFAQLSCLVTCISAAKVNAGLHVDLRGQPLSEEARRGASDGSRNVSSTSGTGTQEPSSSTTCKCDCHDHTMPSAVGQVKKEQDVVVRGAPRLPSWRYVPHSVIGTMLCLVVQYQTVLFTVSLRGVILTVLNFTQK